MIITCKECNSSFNVDDSLIKEAGSKVRCSKCENIFVAYPHTPEDDLLLDSDEQLLGSDGAQNWMISIPHWMIFLMRTNP